MPFPYFGHDERFADWPYFASPPEPPPARRWPRRLLVALAAAALVVALAAVLRPVVFDPDVSPRMERYLWCSEHKDHPSCRPSTERR